MIKLPRAMFVGLRGDFLKMRRKGVTIEPRGELGMLFGKKILLPHQQLAYMSGDMVRWWWVFRPTPEQVNEDLIDGVPERMIIDFLRNTLKLREVRVTVGQKDFALPPL